MLCGSFVTHYDYFYKIRINALFLRHLVGCSLILSILGFNFRNKPPDMGIQQWRNRCLILGSIIDTVEQIHRPVKIQCELHRFLIRICQLTKDRRHVLQRSACQIIVVELKTLEAMNSAETYLTSTAAAVEAETQAAGAQPQAADDINVDSTTASASAAGTQPTSTLGSTAGAQTPVALLGSIGSASSKPTFAVPGDVLRKAHTVKLNDNIDCIQIPKFSIGRGMAGKTLKFSLSRGGRQNLERVMRIVQESGVHPSIFITEHYDGLDQIAQAIDDMKERKAIKIAVKI